MDTLANPIPRNRSLGDIAAATLAKMRQQGGPPFMSKQRDGFE